MGEFSPEEIREIKEIVAKVLPQGNSGAIMLDYTQGSGIASIHIPIKWSPTLDFADTKATIRDQVEAKILEASVCQKIIIRNMEREAELHEMVKKAEVYKNHFQLEYLLKHQQPPDLR